MGRHRRVNKRVNSSWMRAPGCVTLEQFKHWVEEAVQVGYTGHDVTFCTDCTPEYQAVNLAERLCDHPYIRFFRSADGELYGALDPRQANAAVQVFSSDGAWKETWVSNSIAKELGMG